MGVYVDMNKEKKEEATTENTEVGITKKEAKAQLKSRIQLEANKTKKALDPLRERVLELVQDYEANTNFEHARRMSRLLNNIIIASEICIQEAEKDLSRISVGERACQPSALRQRLCDYFWDN
jgi:hypothetical protein